MANNILLALLGLVLAPTAFSEATDAKFNPVFMLSPNTLTHECSCNDSESTSKLNHLILTVDSLAAKLNTISESISNSTEAGRQPTKEMKEKGCPAGFSRYKSKCYYVSDISVTWENAALACRHMDSDLVALETYPEDHFITELAVLTTGGTKVGNDGDKQEYIYSTVNRKYWIGGLYQMEVREWQWAHSEMKINYTRWDSSSTDLSPGTQDRCVSLVVSNSYATWNNMNCYNQYDFICETLTVVDEPEHV